MSCPPATPKVCGQSSTSGGTCCPNGDCCPGGLCSARHDTGLGQTFYNCTATGTHTAAQAQLAAAVWAPTGVIAGPTETGCPGNCVCTTNGPVGSATAAAVFCYDGSSFSGLVGLTANGLCSSAACPLPGSAPNWN
jgi:hypothetical protein